MAPHLSQSGHRSKDFALANPSGSGPLVESGFDPDRNGHGPNVVRDTPSRATLVYLFFTLLFSSVIWSPIIWSGHLGMAFGTMIVAIMWCPALAALATCRVLGRSIRSLAWRWPEWRYIAVAHFVPLAYAAIAYGAVWALRLGGWNRDLVNFVAQRFGLRGMPAWGSFVLWLLFTATATLIMRIATALGEEIGWRGFLVPELAKQMSFDVDSCPANFNHCSPTRMECFQIVVQGLIKIRYLPLAWQIALDGFYKHPDERIAPLRRADFYDFD